MNLRSLGTGAAVGAGLLALWWLMRDDDDDDDRSGNFVSDFADTGARAAEMFLGGDGRSNVSGQPSTVGSIVFDVREAILGAPGAVRDWWGTDTGGDVLDTRENVHRAQPYGGAGHIVRLGNPASDLADDAAGALFGTNPLTGKPHTVGSAAWDWWNG